MANTYVIKKGDTLAKIAQAKMGSRRQAATLADSNALRTRSSRSAAASSSRRRPT